MKRLQHIGCLQTLAQDALTEIERRLTSADSQEFHALFKEIKQRIIDPVPDAVTLSDRVIKLVNNPQL